MKNFKLKLSAAMAMISNADGRTVREGSAQPGELPAFTRGEVVHHLELTGVTDKDLVRAGNVLCAMELGGMTYRLVRWALVQARGRMQRRHEAVDEAINLGADPMRIRSWSTDRILATSDEEIAKRRGAAFYSQMRSTVRSINVYEKVLGAKLTTVDVAPTASKSVMETRYADLLALLAVVERLATKPQAKGQKAVAARAA